MEEVMKDLPAGSEVPTIKYKHSNELPTSVEDLHSDEDDDTREVPQSNEVDDDTMDNPQSHEMDDDMIEDPQSNEVDDNVIENMEFNDVPTTVADTCSKQVRTVLIIFSGRMLYLPFLLPI